MRHRVLEELMVPELRVEAPHVLCQQQAVLRAPTASVSAVQERWEGEGWVVTFGAMPTIWSQVSKPVELRSSIAMQKNSFGFSGSTNTSMTPGTGRTGSTRLASGRR